MAEPADWSGLMRLGLGVLRLEPDVFWAMTPHEFRMMLEGAGLSPGAGPLQMGRDGLERLMADFPDGRDGRPDRR